MLAVRYTTLAVNKVVKDALNVAFFDASTALALVTFQREDHQEALAALREKRLPVFTDRRATPPALEQRVDAQV